MISSFLSIFLFVYSHETSHGINRQVYFSVYYSGLVNVAVRALGYIAVVWPELRDHIIEQGIIEPMLALLKPDTSVSSFLN